MTLTHMHSPRRAAEGVTLLSADLPLPGLGILPINAFVLHGPRPMLVDTGLPGLRADFMAALASVIDPADLAYVWITHTDADHLGSLDAVLQAAPNARLVTTYLGMGKMSLMGRPVDRAYLLNPGQTLDLSDRAVTALAPPCFDAPETTGLFDPRGGILFSADAFGCPVSAPAETAADIPVEDLRAGMQVWAQIDAPWLGMTDGAAYAARLDEVRRLAPRTILGSHLPPAHGMTDTLLGNLAEARTAPPFIGPDQAALESMMAAA